MDKISSEWMYTTLCGRGFLITLLAILLLRPLSYTVNWLDKPGGRKKHIQDVPMIGGLALFLGLSVTLWNQLCIAKPYWIFWLGSGLLLLIALLDDFVSIRPGYRFLLQFVVIIAMAVLGDATVSYLGNVFGTGLIHLNGPGVLFTGIAAVGIINAVNMMDGIDGLTACVSLVELFLLFFLAVNHHNVMESMMIITVIGALFAFLLFNFPIKHIEKRKIFLGDSGSMFLGLFLAWLAIRLTQPITVGYPPVLMLWVVALPLMDTLRLIVDRKRRGVSPFQADRRHIHHILLNLHYSPIRVIIMLTGFSSILGASGVFLYAHHVSDAYLFWGIVSIFVAFTLSVYWLHKRITQNRTLPRRSQAYS